METSTNFYSNHTLNLERHDQTAEVSRSYGKDSTTTSYILTNTASSELFTLNGTQVLIDKDNLSMLVKTREAVGWFILVYCPLLMLIGTIFNGLSAAVLTRPSMRRVSANVYLTVLTVFDTVFVYTVCLPRFIQYLPGSPIDLHCIAKCKLYPVFIYWSAYVSRWLLVLVAVDRFIVVYFPFHKILVCTPRKAYVISACLALVTLPLGVQWAVMIDGKSKSGSYIFISEDARYYFDHIWLKVSPITGLVLPAGILLIMNLLIIYRLRKLSSDSERASDSAAFNRCCSNSSTRMLVAVSSAYVILLAPISVINVLTTYVYLNNSSVDVTIRLYIAGQLAMFTSALNSVINFPLYCVSGRMFRLHFWRLLRGDAEGRQVPHRESVFTTETQM